MKIMKKKWNGFIVKMIILSFAIIFSIILYEAVYYYVDVIRERWEINEYITTS